MHARHEKQVVASPTVRVLSFREASPVAQRSFRELYWDFAPRHPYRLALNALAVIRPLHFRNHKYAKNKINKNHKYHKSVMFTVLLCEPVSDSKTTQQRTAATAVGLSTWLQIVCYPCVLLRNLMWWNKTRLDQKSAPILGLCSVRITRKPEYTGPPHLF